MFSIQYFASNPRIEPLLEIWSDPDLFGRIRTLGTRGLKNNILLTRFCACKYFEYTIMWKNSSWKKLYSIAQDPATDNEKSWIRIRTVIVLIPNTASQLCDTLTNFTFRHWEKRSLIYVFFLKYLNLHKLIAVYEHEHAHIYSDLTWTCRCLYFSLIDCRNWIKKMCTEHRYIMTRLSLQVVYLWRHVSSTAPPFILWWWNLEILLAPLHRSSPFIEELRCQAIQMEHGLI
jgi:hypothetical protein